MSPQAGAALRRLVVQRALAAALLAVGLALLAFMVAAEGEPGLLPLLLVLGGGAGLAVSQLRLRAARGRR